MSALLKAFKIGIDPLKAVLWVMSLTKQFFHIEIGHTSMITLGLFKMLQLIYLTLPV